MDKEHIQPGFKDVLDFKLMDALFGRRARHFLWGLRSRMAISSINQSMTLSSYRKRADDNLFAAAGNTGWHSLIMRGERYAPGLSNYACSAGGRTFPSAAGFHTSELFFTDDTGVYFFETRDAPELTKRSENGTFDVEELHETKARISKPRVLTLYLVEICICA